MNNAFTKLEHHRLGTAAATAVFLLAAYGCSAMFGLDDLSVTTSSEADDPCTTCAFESCTDELMACQGDEPPGCAAFLACFDACADEACVTACGLANPAGSELGSCICTACADACDHCPTGAGGNAASGGAAGATSTGGSAGAGSNNGGNSA